MQCERGFTGRTVSFVEMASSIRSTTVYAGVNVHMRTIITFLDIMFSCFARHTSHLVNVAYPINSTDNKSGAPSDQFRSYDENGASATASVFLSQCDSGNSACPCPSTVYMLLFTERASVFSSIRCTLFLHTARFRSVAN